MRIIVGYSGLVGSNLLQFYKFDKFFNSKNFEDAKYLEVDEIFFCGIPAVKWHANKYPDEDYDTINKIKEILKTIKAKKIILISTIDVYENSSCQHNEDYDCDIFLNNTYGRNRYLFELFVKETFANYHIVRLPALFGKGLKKNVIYDLINNNLVENISANTKFQWYDLNWLKNDIDIVVKNNIKICNLFTEPLDTIEIIMLFNYPIETFKNTQTLTYDVKTKYGSFFGSNNDSYIRNKMAVLHNIKLYIQFNSINREKLVVSNICVKHICQFQFANILKLFGIKNVQIAPTKLISDWDDINGLNLEIYEKHNLNTYAFQSITFGLTHNIFVPESVELLKSHIKNVIDIAVKLNIKVLVFGCPKNRFINKDIENPDNIFVSFFNELGNYIDDRDLKICIEPNSKVYNCNYLNTISEAGNIVKLINNKNIKLMVDIGNSIMENEDINDIYKYSDVLYNIDISQENMKNFCNPHRLNHTFKNIISKLNYANNINLEMLLDDTTPELELEQLKKSLTNFVNIYGI